MTPQSRTHERLTVNLIKNSSEALDKLTELTGLNKTDLVNRALQIYVFLETTKADGEKMFVGSNADKVFEIRWF